MPSDIGTDKDKKDEQTKKTPTPSPDRPSDEPIDDQPPH